MSNLCFGQFLELGDKPVALVRHRNVPLNVAVICMVLYLLCSASERWAISAPRVLWLAGLMSGAGFDSDDFVRTPVISDKFARLSRYKR